MVHSEVYLNNYVISIAPFSTSACPDCSRFCTFSLLNFSSIFPGGQLTPFAAMCGRPCDGCAGDPVECQTRLPGSPVRTRQHGAGAGVGERQPEHARHIRLPSAADVQRHRPAAAAAVQDQQDEEVSESQAAAEHLRQVRRDVVFLIPTFTPNKTATYRCCVL